MIISKDLFIFGEQIFATIIPEGGSSQTSQQQQQQQQQQQAQHQLAIINTTTLTTAAAAAAISATQITTALTTSTATAAGTAPPAAAATTGPGTGTATTTAATATVGAAETAVVEAKLQKIPKEVEEHKQQHQYKQQQQQQQQQPAQHLAKTRKKESQQKGLSDENGGIKISANNTRTEQQQQQQQQLPQQKQQESLANRVAAAATATTAVGVAVGAIEANARTKDSEKEPLVKRNLAKIKPTTTATITAARATPATAAVGVEAAGIGTGAVAGAAVAIANPKTTTTTTTTATATPETATTATSNFAIHEATPLLLGERAEALPADCHLQLQLDAEVPSASTTTTIAATSDRSSIAADQPEHSLRSLNSNEDLPPLSMAKVMLGNNTRSDHAMATFPFISAAEPHHQHTLQLTFQSINVLHNDRKILSDVSGLVSPGEVLAIMGPSGSGKTTLLDCLSGQRRIDSGAVYLNREPLSKKWRRKICYVLQEEVFFSGLTLRETVMYTALLRLPEKMPKAEKIKLVDNILEALELKFCQQTKFGDYLNRGLSGGEKKRANIACELLTNPLLMLLDEPTSGLDSHSAISLMKFLKRYAMEEQKTVVITVHQPSSQMFHMFDKLLLLYNGRTAYFGEVNNIYSYFENIGVAIKPHYNPADFVLEQLKSYPDIREKLFIAAKESHGNFLNRNCITVNTNNHSDYHTHHEHHNHNHNHSHHAHHRHNGQNGSIALGSANGGDVYTTTTAEVVNEKAHKHDSLINDIINNYYKDMHNNHNHSHNHHINHDAMLIIGDHQTSTEEASQQLWYGVDSQSNSSASTGDCQRYESCDRDRDCDSDWLDYPTRFHTQFSVLSSRNFKEAKPRMLSKLNWFQTVGLALMAGSIWFQIPRTEEFLHDLQGWMFFSQTYWMLFALFGALNSFPSEREVISKERRSGAYRLSAYYLAKMFGELPLVVTLPTVYLMISYPMLGCSSFKLFFLMLVFLLLNTIVAQSVGFFIGACCMDMNVSITLSALYTLATQLFGGYLSSRIPDGLSWLRYTSMIHYAYQNMQILEFREGPAIRCGNPSSYEICKANSTTPHTFIPYEEILKAQNSTSPLWLNTLVLTMFFLVFRGLGYAVLRYVRCPKT